MPASVVEPVDVSGQRVLVDVQGQQQTVSAALLISDSTDLPRPGDWVLVHMGFALSRMDESEARSVLESLDDLNDMYADQLHAHAAESERQRS
ncbi:MAG: HypC/HybG/HupF family hydrogenase formation chaperone [Nocardioidaceae bacterium]|nr:HypC/HybG/HupF family hydrogenase formation chaperone [Nocardioidaceae bacterium]